MAISSTPATGTGWPVAPVAEADVPTLTATLSAAFYDDPIFRWWIPEDQRRTDILPPFFEVVAGMCLSRGAVEATEKIRAASLWVPPGMQPTADEMAELMPKFAAATEEYADTLFELLERMEEIHPTEPHWYLFVLGTRPEWQSRGMGAALLRSVLDGCDRDGVPAYLESSSEGSKRLYLRHGFEVTSEIRLRDSPPGWAMWRTPRDGR